MIIYRFFCLIGDNGIYKGKVRTNNSEEDLASYMQEKFLEKNKKLIWVSFRRL